MDTCSNCIPEFRYLAKLQTLRFPEMSRTNQSVSDQERQDLVNLLRNATDELALYSRTIAQLQGLVWKLKRERESLQCHVGWTRSMLAPVRRLPAEVLSEIFVHHGQENTITTSPLKFELPALPLITVCSFWRKIAFATPRLWSNIALTITGPTEDQVVTVVNFLLHHSSNADLQLTVDLTEQIQGDDANLPFMLLCQQSQRWGSFNGRLDAGNPCQAATLTSIRGSLDRLKVLALRNNVDDLPTDWQEIFVTCPRLTRIHGATTHELELRLPLDQITHSRVFVSGESWEETIVRFPNLDTIAAVLHGDASDESEDEDEDLTPFTSPLKKLIFELYPSETMRAFRPFIRRAVLPRLNNLVIAGSTYEDDGDDDELPLINLPIHDMKDLFQRSSCAITRLQLTEIEVPSALFDLLAILPAINEFVLHVSENSTSHKADNAIILRVIRGMTVQNAPNLLRNPTTLLPSLTSLDIRCSGGSNLEDQLLLDFIQSRRQCLQQDVSKLKSFEFHRTDGCFGYDFVQTMLFLKECGLLMSVKDSIGDIEVRF